MSERARRAYNEYFSPEVGFHHVAELCRELVEAGSPQRFPTRGVIDRWYAELALVRSLARAKYWGGRATRLATRIGRPRPSAAQEA
jgi:hypothetical protein